MRMHFCLSNVCIVTKRNNLLPKFLYHIKGLFFLCVNTVSDKVVRHSLSYLSLQKLFARHPLLYGNLLPLNPQEGCSKRKMAVLGQKVHYSQRKSATKFLCVKTVRNRVTGIRVIICLSTRAKQLVWMYLLHENLAKTDPPLSKTPISNIHL